MKNTIIFLILHFAVCLSTGSFLPASAHSAEAKGGSPIELLGKLSGGGTRSHIAFPPITAFQYSDYIEVNFSESLGTISVSIYDDSGNIVYNGAIDTSLQSVLYIDTARMEKGEYSIRFTNTEGEYLEGSFGIE